MPTSCWKIPARCLTTSAIRSETTSSIKTRSGQAAEHINIRFVNLPKKTGIRHIRSDDINTFVTVEGILRKTTEVRPRIVNAVFRCPGGHITEKRQGYGQFIEPDGCATDGCTFKKLELIPKKSRFVDSQKIRIQEQPEGLRGGNSPRPSTSMLPTTSPVLSPRETGW